MIFIVLVCSRGVGAEGEEAPLRQHVLLRLYRYLYRLYRLCTATFALGGTALTLVYQAKLYVVPLVPLLFYNLRTEKYI